MTQAAERVQRESSSSTEPTRQGGQRTGSTMRQHTRGMSYAEGSAALAPVQHKGAGAGDAGVGGKVGGAKPAGGKPASGGAAGQRGGPTTAGGSNAESSGAGDKPGVAGMSEAKMEKVTEDLGEVSTMGEAGALIGSAIGLLAPRAGTAAEASLKIAIFAVGLYTELGIEVSVKHTEAGFEIAGATAVSVGVGVTAAGMKAWAGLQGKVGFTAKGDSATECLDLMLLGIHTWMCDQTITVYEAITSPIMSIITASGGMKWLADQIFGEGFDEAVLKQMDPGSAGDEADTLLFEQQLGVDAGVSGSIGAGDAKVGAGVGVTVAGAEKTTYQKGADGKLEQQTDRGINGQIGLDLEAGGFSAKGSCKFWKPTGGQAEVEIALEIGLPAGSPISALAAMIWEMWGNVISGNIKGIQNEELRAELEESALTTPRAMALAALTACHFVHPAVEFVFGISGPEREFAIELVQHTSGEFTAGAVIGGASVEVEAATKTEVWHHHWSNEKHAAKGGAD